MDLSIIIISKDTKVLLSRCLTSIERTCKKVPFTFEILVVDNASKDGSVQMVRSRFPKVIVVENTSNLGFGKANNQGIKKSKGTYVLLLNSDTEVENGAIEGLLAYSRSHPKSFIGPRLVNPDGTRQTSCGPFFTLPVVFAALFLKGDRLGITRWSPKSVKRVDWVSGASIISRKTSFLDDLLFDEHIFMYMEEIDLLYRAKQKGYEVFFYSEATVMHVGSGSSKDSKKSPILNIYKGFQLFYRKHYPRWQLPVLQAMLQCKALLAILYGYSIGDKQTVTTYEEAIALVQ